MACCAGRSSASSSTLSQAETATITLPYRSTTLTWTVSRERFTALCEPLYKRIRQPIERALRDARIHPGELSAVVLAGGATRMPALRRMITLLFRHMPRQHLDPDQVVALGAAVHAGLMMRDAALDERVLTDVAPFTLGVEVADRQEGHVVRDLFLPIIERNTVIPASCATTLQHPGGPPEIDRRAGLPGGIAPRQEQHPARHPGGARAAWRWPGSNWWRCVSPTTQAACWRWTPSCSAPARIITC